MENNSSEIAIAEQEKDQLLRRRIDLDQKQIESYGTTNPQLACTLSKGMQ